MIEEGRLPRDVAVATGQNLSELFGQRCEALALDAIEADLISAHVPQIIEVNREAGLCDLNNQIPSGVVVNSPLLDICVECLDGRAVLDRLLAQVGLKGNWWFLGRSLGRSDAGLQTSQELGG